MELKEAREQADIVRGQGDFSSSGGMYGAVVTLDERITELESQIKNDTGYREMKTLYNQIVKENKDNYEKRKELEADVGSEKNISVRWRGMYNDLCSVIHAAVVVGENQERDYPENELKRLTDRKTELETENTKLRELVEDADEVLSLGNEATEEQHDRAERLQKQRDALLAACEAALEKCPFPVGTMKVKQQLKDAILKTK